MSKTQEYDEPPQGGFSTGGARTGGSSGLVFAVTGAGESQLLKVDRDGVVGRAQEAEYFIDHRAISRRHARVSLGPPVTIEDLGSANGTRVGGISLAPGSPYPLHPGDIIEIGVVKLTVRGASELPGTRVVAHGEFIAAADQACANAAATGNAFSVVRLSVRGEPSNDVIEGALLAVVRGSDLIGYYAPREFEVLMLGLFGPRAADVAERLVAGLREHGVECAFGVACFREHGRTTDELLGYARRKRSAPAADPSMVIVPSGAMSPIYDTIDRVAAGTISVLLTGETGVGKEVLAAAVHQRSARSAAPFVKLNCAALTPTLLESELFGHEKGAFTGAFQTKQGLLESANGGTVFLDEIGELPMELQVKLLRALEERHVMRVGSVRPRPIDVRFVAATNRDLELECKEGRFRPDLYYRLSGAVISVPPLRARREEILALAELFVARAATELALRRVPRLEEDTLDAMQAYDWPGNIRELKNAMERAVLVCGDSDIAVEHLPLKRHAIAERSLSASATMEIPRDLIDEALLYRVDGDSLGDEMRRQLTEVERQFIEEALRRTGGHQQEAARLLGVSRRTLLYKLDQFGIDRPLKGRAGRLKSNGD